MPAGPLSVELRIKRLPGNADVPLPAKQTPHAAGMDVCAAVSTDVVIEPGAIAMIPCGFAMALPEGWEAQIRPRSGLGSKFGVTLPNAPGTIDCDYRGEVKVPLINHGAQPFTVSRGMRIAQMVIAQVPTVTLIETSELDPTDRGDKGFGSTGH